MKVAVIGIGSNSVRMLEADISGHKGKRTGRERAGTRLFAGLDEAGYLAEDAMNTTTHAVASMACAARDHGAEEVLLFATSATRDAKNQEAFANKLRLEAGVDLQICSGEEEAALSFLGATGSGRSGVIDIGGGSTEIVVGEGFQLDTAFSCQMGAVRLYQALPITKAEDMAKVIETAQALLQKNLTTHPILQAPPTWFGTGGTFTALGAMVKNVPWTDRTNMHGTIIHKEEAFAWGRRLANLSVEERKELICVQPNRADIVVHGICILLACMEQLNLNAITVSEYGNLDGFMKYHYQLSEGLI